jgi:hypothetical protein
MTSRGEPEPGPRVGRARRMMNVVRKSAKRGSACKSGTDGARQDSPLHLPVAPHSSITNGDAPPGEWAKTENVIFSYEPAYRSTVQYFSMPSACIGSAASLDEARRLYQSDLAALSDAVRIDLPGGVEHLETRAGRHWIRTMLGPAPPVRAAADRLRHLLDVEDESSHNFERHLADISGTREPLVVIVVEGSSPVSDLLNQMTRFDQISVGYVDPNARLDWLVLCGPETTLTPRAARSVEADTVHAMPIAIFARTYGANGPVRLL